MYSQLLSQAPLVLGFLGVIVAAVPDCKNTNIYLLEEKDRFPALHQADWICPTGIPKPRYHNGKWPTPEQEAHAKALIGPVSKTDACGWKADGHICKATQNTGITLDLVAARPLTIKVKINNYDAYPITFWKKYSPLSESAFEQGYFKISQGEQFVVTHAPQPEGYRPDDPTELAVINPCEALEQDIFLTDPNHAWHHMVKNGGDIKISMSGRWNGFWATSAPEVMKSDLGYSCKGIWNSLGMTWSARNTLTLRFPQDHYVSSEPTDNWEYDTVKASAEAPKPHVSENPEDEAEPEKSSASGQLATESPESVIPENEAEPETSSANEPSSSESPTTEPPTTEPSASVSPEWPATEEASTAEASTTPASSATPEEEAEEETEATAATPTWATMASTTAQPVFSRSAEGARGRSGCR
ncbi:uncharacterized protein BKA55DRAFT_491542, partial [Fusarium redolens]